MIDLSDLSGDYLKKSDWEKHAELIQYEDNENEILGDGLLEPIILIFSLGDIDFHQGQ